MTILNRADIRELIEQDRLPCVSIFLPTHRGTREERQDPIRLKNLKNEALAGLCERGQRRAEAETILAPLDDALTVTESERRRGDGLACFAAKHFFRAYCVPLRLVELAVVNERFYVKPLLPLLHSNGRFYVMMLSKENARLFEATRDSIRELPLPEIARSELDGPKETLQYHAHQAPSQGRGSTGEAMYHGQGGPDDRTKTDILNFFHRVNDAVRQVLHADRAPLVLACVDYLAPIYAAANSYSGLLANHVSGNPEQLSLEVLREQAWQVVEPHFNVGREEALEQWQSLAGKPMASSEIREVVLAANEGRVDNLFVRPDVQQWGRVEPARRVVELLDGEQPGAVELLDYAAARSLAQGADVYAVDQIPTTDSPLAAVFRY